MENTVSSKNPVVHLRERTGGHIGLRSRRSCCRRCGRCCRGWSAATGTRPARRAAAPVGGWIQRAPLGHNNRLRSEGDWNVRIHLAGGQTELSTLLGHQKLLGRGILHHDSHGLSLRGPGERSALLPPARGGPEIVVIDPRSAQPIARTTSFLREVVAPRADLHIDCLVGRLRSDIQAQVHVPTGIVLRTVPVRRSTD